MSARLIALLASLIALPAAAQDGPALTGAQLTELLSKGATLQLGGDGMGYKGQLALATDGTGKGGAKTDDGTEIAISGTWRIDGDQFCRTWEGMDGGEEVCETWHSTSPSSVQVFVKGKMIGVNSW
jgi:hypothetical protein